MARKKKKKEVQEVLEVGAEQEEEEDEIDSEEAAEELRTEKWWLKDPWRSLLDPDLADNVDLTKFDLSKLIEEFTDKMIEEDFIDFRISGMAIYSSAKFYHQKITGVIDEEEKIERERKKRKLKRQIPNSIKQPLRQTQKITTSDELFGAMRRAIIETMQRREKLRKRRVKRKRKKTKKKKVKNKGKLPAELLKHVTGSEETVEETLNKWHNKIIEIEENQKSVLTMNDVKHAIYNNDKIKLLEKQARYIQAFQAMLHLMALNKVNLIQPTMEEPIEIKIRDKSKIDFD